VAAFARSSAHKTAEARQARPSVGSSRTERRMTYSLVRFSLVSSAASPTWTDWIQAGAAVIAAIGVVGGFVYSGIQLRKGRREQTAQRALSLMQLLIDITRVMVERPRLAPYLYDGKDPPNEKGEDRDEVLAYGRLFMSFGEAVGWQLHAHEMDPDAKEAWTAYFMDLYKKSPAVRSAIEENKNLLAQETSDLFLGPGP
jgi:hypothetical protein